MYFYKTKYLPIYSFINCSYRNIQNIKNAYAVHVLLKRQLKLWYGDKVLNIYKTTGYKQNICLKYALMHLSTR